MCTYGVMTAFAQEFYQMPSLVFLVDMYVFQITNSFAALEAEAKEIRDASKEKAQAKLDALY